MLIGIANILQKSILYSADQQEMLQNLMKDMSNKEIEKDKYFINVKEILSNQYLSFFNPIDLNSLLIQIPLELILYSFFGFDTAVFANPFIYIALFKRLYYCDEYNLISRMQSFISDAIFFGSLTGENSAQMQELVNIFNILQSGNFKKLDDIQLKQAINICSQTFNHTNKFNKYLKNNKQDVNDQMAAMSSMMITPDLSQVFFDDIGNKLYLQTYGSIMGTSIKTIFRSAYNDTQNTYNNHFIQLYLDSHNKSVYSDENINMISPIVAPNTLKSIKNICVLFSKFAQSQRKKKGFHILVVESLNLTSLLAYKLQETLKYLQLRFFVSEGGENQDNQFIQNSYRQSTLKKIQDLQIKQTIPKSFLNLNTLFYQLFMSTTSTMNSSQAMNLLHSWNINVVDISNATRMNLNNYDNLIFTGNLLNMKYKNLHIYREPILIAYANSLLHLDSAIESRFQYKLVNDKNYPYYRGNISLIVKYILSNSYYYNNVKITYNNHKQSSKTYVNLLEEFANMLLNRGYKLEKCYGLIDILFDYAQKGKIFSIDKLKQIV